MMSLLFFFQAYKEYEDGNKIRLTENVSFQSSFSFYFFLCSFNYVVICLNKSFRKNSAVAKAACEPPKNEVQNISLIKIS